MNINRLPLIRGLVRRYNILKGSLDLYIPPGHYYSPIVSKKEVQEDLSRIFDTSRELSGVELNHEQQMQLLHLSKPYYKEFIKDYEQDNSNRYYNPRNGFYSYTDGIFLYSFMRHFKPSRIVEVGSGYSSMLMFDVANNYFDGKLSLTFIEPYPEDRLLKLYSGSNSMVQIIKSKVQHVPLEKLTSLEANDILFIDSSHVSKTGSDVNFLLFEVLPRLKSGVIIHFHDIFFPFEYPRDHVLGNRWYSWNEAYILRAFLTCNEQFSIIFWNSYMEHAEAGELKTHFPKYFEGGSKSIWLKKL